MTHQNLLLTEKAIKNHSKRLLKELQKIHPDITLGQAQNIFAKSLGFNNLHELKNIINQEPLQDFNIYEKYVFVIFHLILDNNTVLSFKFIDNFHTEGIDEFLINLLFEKYRNSSLSMNMQKKYNKKEFFLLHMIDLVRKKIKFPCAYLIALRKLDIQLWYLLFYSGRTISNKIIKDDKLRNVFNNYQQAKNNY